jgi:molybdopterin synthase catalytic subunit
VRDENGEIYTVRYEAVNAMLLNEFLKEHRKVEEQSHKLQKQEATLAELRKEMETRFREQDAKIQRVNDRIEISDSATAVAVSNR